MIEVWRRKKSEEMVGVVFCRALACVMNKRIQEIENKENCVDDELAKIFGHDKKNKGKKSKNVNGLKNSNSVQKSNSNTNSNSQNFEDKRKNFEETPKDAERIKFNEQSGEKFWVHLNSRNEFFSVVKQGNDGDCCLLPAEFDEFSEDDVDENVEKNKDQILAEEKEFLRKNKILAEVAKRKKLLNKAKKTQNQKEVRENIINTNDEVQQDTSQVEVTDSHSDTDSDSTRIWEESFYPPTYDTESYPERKLTHISQLEIQPHNNEICPPPSPPPMRSPDPPSPKPPALPPIDGMCVCVC